MLSAKIRKIGKKIVPIVPDEARTFGMEGMFRQMGIYSAMGQLYDPADSNQVMYYREDKKGQMLEEGYIGIRRFLRMACCSDFLQYK